MLVLKLSSTYTKCKFDRLNYFSKLLSYIFISILDLKNTVFGKVIDGLDNLDALERQPVNPKNFKPVKGNECKIERITIHANPLAG